MIKEVNSAIRFLSLIIKPVLSDCTHEQIEAFQKSLIGMLCLKFERHWDESNPMKGNAFRSLMLSCSFVDPILQEAARECSFEISKFSTELTIWIDPGEVTYRIGEAGSIDVVDMSRYYMENHSLMHQHENKNSFITAK